MDIAKRLPIICVSLVMLGGCTTTSYMDRHAMNNMAIDCEIADKQIAFLESQQPTEQDSVINALMIRSWAGYVASVFDGTYNKRRDWDNGARTNAVRLQIYNIQKTCIK